MYIKLCKYRCRAFRQGGFSVCHASVTWAFVELLCVVVSFYLCLFNAHVGLYVNDPKFLAQFYYILDVICV